MKHGYEQLTVNSGAATDISPAWDDSSTSVEVWARFGDMEGDGGTVRREILDKSAGLNMARDVVGMLATLDDEDLEKGISGG